MMLKMIYLIKLRITAVAIVMAAMSTSAFNTREGHFQACAEGGSANDDLPLAVEVVPNSLACATRCLMLNGCFSYFLIPYTGKYNVRVVVQVSLMP
ncbi:hypothetical protein ElyMa_003858300 [Elysia marginata]|uniref:Apple domain-containing protein n=1 Tax=Elysia marginata TaxID=1093978 RepID=A0AAV4FJ91_9GAST|nr:hypothetical protein ElyMa_003858300 [Elysia marginata]